MPFADWLAKWWPALAFVGNLLVNAAMYGWFARGFKADWDRVVGDVVANKRQIDAAVALLQKTRADQSDLEHALGIQGAELANLRADYNQMTDLVLERMPRILQESAARSERTVETAISRALGRRRRS